MEIHGCDVPMGWRGDNLVADFLAEGDDDVRIGAGVSNLFQYGSLVHFLGFDDGQVFGGGPHADGGRGRDALSSGGSIRLGDDKLDMMITA